MTLPELHLAGWHPTKDTLHLYCQILGKIRLATTPPRNHWWNVPLYVDVRGLTTRRLHHRGTTFEITIDVVDHALVVRTADGRGGSFDLGGGLPVADFDAAIHQVLAELGIDVAIKEDPFGVPMTTPFAQDVTHGSWDREAIARFGRILDWSDLVAGEPTPRWLPPMSMSSVSRPDSGSGTVMSCAPKRSETTTSLSS